MVVRSAPTSTTNMTGFLIMVRGSSLRQESTIARRRILESRSEMAWCCRCSGMGASESLSGKHLQVLEDGTKAERGEEGERADDEDGGNEKSGEQTAGYGKCSCGRRGDFFLGEISGDGQDGNDHEEAAEKHGGGAADVVPGSVAIEAAESGAVVAYRRSVEIKNLREPVGARIGDAGGAIGTNHGDGGEAENDESHDQDGEHGHFYVVGFDFLAEIFGGAADHESGDKDGEDNEDDYTVEAGAHAAEDDFTEHDVDERDHAAERCEGVMGTIDGAATGVGGGGGEERGVGDAEADFFAFHVASGLRGAGDLIRSGEEGIAFGFGPVGGGYAQEEQDDHGGPDGPAMAGRTGHAAKSVGQAGGDR